MLNVNNMDVMRLNPAHITEFPNGFVLDDRYIQEIHLPESASAMYYVSPDFVEDEEYHRFNSINAANEYVLANLPTYPIKATIVVYPGIYEESIENSFYRIHIVGTAPTSYYLKGAILYNTGADADHYPIKCSGTSALNIMNLTVMVDTGGCFGELPNIRADNCSFRTGYFTECTSTASRTCEFRHCNIKGDGFVLSGESGDRFIAFRNCDMYGGTLEFNSTNAAGKTKSIKFSKSMLSADAEINGDWAITGYLSELYGSAVIKFGTSASITLDKMVFPNGIHFTANSSCCEIITDCNFKNSTIAVDHKDVSADVTITDVIYSGNDQQNGICGCLQITDSEKNVGNGTRDRYFSLQDAITSVPAGEYAIIRVWEDQVDLPEITLPNANTNINVNGQKKYSLTFTGDIVEIGDNQIFGFSDMGKLDGGNIELNGTNAELSFESCQYIVGYVTLTAGVFAILYKSSLFGSTGHKAINVNNTLTPVIIGYSRVQGSTGNAAVEFTVDADNKLKAKYSTFIHGDKDTSAPLFFTGSSGKVDIAMYNCGLNAAWDPAKIYNTIGSANVTTDIGITF